MTTSIPEKNSTHIISIESVTAKGFGIGKLNGFTIFVEGGLPGDNLKIHITKAKSHYGYGKIIDILEPSPHRKASPCPVSDRCGGCQWQHAEYEAQLEYKKQIVIDALERIGGIKSPPVLDVMGMLKPTNYRNKAVFPVVPASNEHGFAIGMFSPRSHRIVEVDNCLIQHPAHIAVLKVVKKFMRRNNITPYNEITHKGIMRFVMIRTSLATKEVMVVLTINSNGLPHEMRLAEDLEKIGVTTVVISRNTSKNNLVLGDHFRVISGSGYIKERIGHVEYQISAPSFFQINPVQTKGLYEIATRQAITPTTSIPTNISTSEIAPQSIEKSSKKISESELFFKRINELKTKKKPTIIDAHVGAGGVSLYAARNATNILGVDIVEAAIEDGKKNAELNGITNLSFICGAAEDIIPPMLEQDPLTCPQVIFLDPPRKGCDPSLLDAIISAKIQHIVYISCDPATFARDVKILVAGGYNLLVVQPVDMFPHTGKVEVSAVLQRM